MRIGLVAPPWVPVPPVGYGGTESVLDTLARGLTAAGHDVRLFTVGESSCPVPRRWYYDTAVEPMNTSLEEAAHVLAAYDALADVDVIHDHTAIGMAVAARRRPGPPVVTTQHNRFTADARLVLRHSAAYGRVVAISHAHARSAGDVPIAAVIPHGIDLDRHPFGAGGGGYLMYVGRMTADKGVRHAVELAHRDGRPLVLAVKMRTPQERAYFDEHVRAVLHRRDTVLVEPPRQLLLALLGDADALLNPIDWEEPFGLVMVEAQACGTPVVATPRGAAPELVAHGVTGYLADTDEGLLAGLRVARELDRQECRARIRRLYSADRMVADHVALYSRLVVRRPAVSGAVYRRAPSASHHPMRLRSS